MIKPHEFRAFGVNSWGPLKASLRKRTRLWAAAGLWAGVLLCAFDAYAAAVTFIPEYRVRNDFRLDYGAALAAWQHGYSHLYDLAAQKAATESLGPGFYWQPYLNPPPLAWIATPFLVLPFGPAIWLWSGLLIGAAAFAWYAVAPGSGLVKAAHLALFLGLFPTAFGLMVGQPAALVAAAVALAWWVAQKERPAAAGVALGLIAIKPQLAILVPLCLLVAGHRKMFWAWLATAAVVVAASLVTLGPDGVQRYRDALSLASQWELTRRYAVAGPLGVGPQLYVAEVVVVAIAALAAWRQRGGDVSRPMATGIVASLLFTPYVGVQDFAILIVAGWLVLRSRATAFQVVIMLVGYVLLEFALVVQAIPILLSEAALLLSLLDSPPKPALAHFEAPAIARAPANARNPRR